jgi:hypothetical protein
MRISGFTMVKNAGKLYYPFKESVLSILPLVDEFVIALGDCDDDDNTQQIIDEIDSPKIKVVHTKWDVKAYPKGTILAQQTDVAKSHCTGDWLFYLQADEVIHEKDLEKIRTRCHELLDDTRVEGLLFRYIHFWGDYQHAFTNNHAWYRNEIRIVRNRSDIHSWRDAQSFRIIDDFSKEKYLSKEGTRKLNVARVDSDVYHYGWVRPPKLMGKKITKFINCYRETSEVISEIDYGPLGSIPHFMGSHPSVMEVRMRGFDWADMLNYTNSQHQGEATHKHNYLKNRCLTALEHLFFKGGLFVFKNYNLVKI